MKELFSLGELYVSDFLKEGDEPRGPKSELKLVMTDDGNVRLEKTAPLGAMFGEYWYQSSINATMRNELKNIVNSILEVKKINDNDIWIDLASNDGCLLSNVPEKIIRIGIDPADDTYKMQAEKYANLIIQDYFSADVFKKSKYGKRKAQIISCIAMFYDIEFPDKFLSDVKEVLDDDGIFVCQLSFSPLMISQLAFDNILHEHVFYYSFFNLKNLFEKNEFQIVDCSLNSTNGGSFRVFAMKNEANIKKFANQPYRDICNFRMNSVLEYEKTLKMDSSETWKDFFIKINELKEKTVSFIKSEKEKGKKIWGLGASTKGNTLLQYFNLDNSLIEYIAERNSKKFGLKTVGTNIPIVSEEEMKTARPDYILVMIWQFIDELKERHKDLLDHGTQFIVPCPKFEIIGCDD